MRDNKLVVLSNASQLQLRKSLVVDQESFAARFFAFFPEVFQVHTTHKLASLLVGSHPSSLLRQACSRGSLGR